LRAHLPARSCLSDPERSTLAEIGQRLDRAALQQVACAAKPDTILARYRRLIARKFERLQITYFPGPAPHRIRLEALIVHFAKENSGWGYDRIVGAPGPTPATPFPIKRSSTILRRCGIQPASKRSQNATWRDFIASHIAVLAAIDFFTVEVLT